MTVPSPSSPPRKRQRKPMDTLGDIVGDISRYGQPLPLYDVLPLIDMVAGRCAHIQSEGPVVTGCFDDVFVRNWLSHGDVIISRADVVDVGNSSMLVRVVTSKDVLEDGVRREIECVTCYSTFVAVDEETGRSRKIPSSASVHGNLVQLPDAKSLKLQYKQNRSLFNTSDLHILEALADATGIPSRLRALKFKRVVNPEHTQITIRKQYLPRHRNFTGVIFGGDVLETLEKSALACVHRMQGGGDFRTIGMRGVSFLKPVDVRVAVEVQATIVSCTEHVVTVMVNSFLDEEHDGSRMVPSHRGVFHIARVVDNDDASLGKIVVGLKQLEGGGLENPDFYRCVAIGMSENLVKKWKLNSDAIVPEQKVLAESN